MDIILYILAFILDNINDNHKFHFRTQRIPAMINAFKRMICPSRISACDTILNPK